MKQQNVTHQGWQKLYNLYIGQKIGARCSKLGHSSHCCSPNRCIFQYNTVIDEPDISVSNADICMIIRTQTERYH